MRAPIACDPSVLPLSATMISPTILCLQSPCHAFLIQLSKVSASFKQGMTTDTSTEASSLADIGYSTSAIFRLACDSIMTSQRQAAKQGEMLVVTVKRA